VTQTMPVPFTSMYGLPSKVWTWNTAVGSMRSASCHAHAHDRYVSPCFFST
jgi:hypothetical protein